jgi:hypothetical protein
MLLLCPAELQPRWKLRVYRDGDGGAKIGRDQPTSYFISDSIS